MVAGSVALAPFVKKGALSTVLVVLGITSINVHPGAASTTASNLKTLDSQQVLKVDRATGDAMKGAFQADASKSAASKILKTNKVLNVGTWSGAIQCSCSSDTTCAGCLDTYFYNDDDETTGDDDDDGAPGSDTTTDNDDRIYAGFDPAGLSCVDLNYAVCDMFGAPNVSATCASNNGYESFIECTYGSAIGNCTVELCAEMCVTYTGGCRSWQSRAADHVACVGSCDAFDCCEDNDSSSAPFGAPSSGAIVFISAAVASLLAVGMS